MLENNHKQGTTECRITLGQWSVAFLAPGTGFVEDARWVLISWASLAGLLWMDGVGWGGQEAELR